MIYRLNIDLEILISTSVTKMNQSNNFYHIVFFFMILASNIAKLTGAAVVTDTLLILKLGKVTSSWHYSAAYNGFYKWTYLPNGIH